MADDDDIKRIPINELRQEDGAHELATSRDMEPYPRLIFTQNAGFRSDARPNDHTQVRL